jgi:predicted DsbA family dithiol-disulfide isomerase
VQIDIVSDVVCPWCLIGRRHLELALEQRPGLVTSIRWRPFLLHPYLSPGGMAKDELMTMKFGRASGRMFRRVEDAARAVGLDVDYDRITRVPDTTAAHCVIDWAEQVDRQDEVATALLSAYFERGEDVGAFDVLARIAGEHGLDEAQVLTRLESGDDRDRIRAEAETARAETITGVPFYVVDGRYPIPGAQSPETIVQVLDSRTRAAAAI